MTNEILYREVPELTTDGATMFLSIFFFQVINTYLYGVPILKNIVYVLQGVLWNSRDA